MVAASVPHMPGLKTWTPENAAGTIKLPWPSTPKLLTLASLTVQIDGLFALLFLV